MTGWGVWPMADFYNTYYSVPEKLTRELYSVSCMSLRRRTIVAGSLSDAWSEFEAAFEDAQGFKEVSADARTRFRLDPLSLAERFTRAGQQLEARGVRLLILYLQSISQAKRAQERFLTRRTHNLMTGELHHRVLLAEIEQFEAEHRTGEATRH